MLVIPLWKASLTLVQGFSHSVGRHLNDCKVAGVLENRPFCFFKRKAKKITLTLSTTYKNAPNFAYLWPLDGFGLCGAILVRSFVLIILNAFIAQMRRFSCAEAMLWE